MRRYRQLTLVTFSVPQTRHNCAQNTVQQMQTQPGNPSHTTTATKLPSMMMPSSIMAGSFDASGSGGLTTEGMSEMLLRMASPPAMGDGQKQHCFQPPTEERDIFAAGDVTIKSPTGGNQLSEVPSQNQMESTILGAPASLGSSLVHHKTNNSSPSQSISSSIGSSMRREELLHFAPPQHQPQQHQPKGAMMTGVAVQQQSAGPFAAVNGNGGILYLSPSSSIYQQPGQSREASVHQYLSPTTHYAVPMDTAMQSIGLITMPPPGMVIGTPGNAAAPPALCVGGNGAVPPPPATSTSFEENYNVLSEDKQTMFSIPTDLIDTTTGSQKYLQQGASACYTFRFQLCRGYRSEGKCVHRQQCAFIHSRHVLHDTLAARVTQTQVHRNAPVASLEKARYPRHPEGVALLVYDSIQSKNLMVDSGSLYVTHGSSAGYRAALADQQQQQHALDKESVNNKPQLPAVASPQQQEQPSTTNCIGAKQEGTRTSPEPSNKQHEGGISGAPAPSAPGHQGEEGGGMSMLLSSVRLQFCLHFDKSLCARGETCNFVHRILIEAPAAPATSGPVAHTSGEMPFQAHPQQLQHFVQPQQKQQHMQQQHGAMLSMPGGSMSLSQGARPNFAPAMGLHGTGVQSATNQTYNRVTSYTPSSPQPQLHAAACAGGNGGSMLAPPQHPHYGGQVYTINSNGEVQMSPHAAASGVQPLQHIQQQQQQQQHPAYQQLQQAQPQYFLMPQQQQQHVQSVGGNAPFTYTTMAPSVRGNVPGGAGMYLANSMPMNAQTLLPNAQQQQQMLFASYPPQQSNAPQQQPPLFATPPWAGLTMASNTAQQSQSGPFDTSSAARYF